MSDLVTGEAVLLELRLARTASRALAFAIDVLVQGAVLLAVLFALTVSSGDFDSALGAALALTSMVATLVGYPVLFETLSRGRTLGKLALGLRVVRDDGGPIRFRQALVRGLAGFFVDFWGLGLLGVVAVVVSLSSRRSKRVGDLLAGTVVIRERTPPPRHGVVAVPPPLAQWAASLECARVPDDLAFAVRQYLGRVGELHSSARDGLGWSLAAEVAGYVGAPAPPGVPAAQYLAAVLGERRAREQTRLGVPPPAVAPPAVAPPGPPPWPPAVPAAHAPPYVPPPAAGSGAGPFVPPN